jgi:hypothetical protein
MMTDALFRLVFFENYLPNCLVRDVAYFFQKKKCLLGSDEEREAELLGTVPIYWRCMSGRRRT